MIPYGTNLSLKNIPWATISLLFLNWVIFITFNEAPRNVAFWIRNYLYSTPGDQYPWQLITSMFFHSDFRHILGNSIFLWVFGIFVEDKLGWKAYLFLYLLTGIAADLIHGMVAGVFLRDRIFVPSLGASGAVSGVMGIYLYRCYYSKIKLLIALWLPVRVQIPAVIVLSLWFLKDFMGGIDTLLGIHKNVAFWAHVGGFASGFSACKYLQYEIPARKEKLEFVAEKSLARYSGYGEGIEASEKLLEGDLDNPEIHLNLARAKTRWRASREGKDHYEKAIKRFLEREPEKAMEVFIEYWRKYLSVLESRYQVRLSALLNSHLFVDLAAHTLQALIDSQQPSDLHMEQAYLTLARIYKEQLNREDLARHVYERLLQRFQESGSRGFVEKRLQSIPE